MKALSQSLPVWKVTEQLIGAEIKVLDFKNVVY